MTEVGNGGFWCRKDGRVEWVLTGWSPDEGHVCGFGVVSKWRTLAEAMTSWWAEVNR